ncbi:acetyl-CoA acetyltransferase [Anaeromyxobacter dehalogenans 2CP-1]|uniref:Acetyl-CoA acetyltransferase n=1 Tax=Anaeromyxobacter dehalogenans (strain ATCC BAA-258 / DSM 21875 / 2CP-1) TaxID=455488 RepID=B8JAY2_ANAD2|nr:acetyl-CoA C-acyltransferase FadI [Anaeromyxobacter dehalogenans]ACL63793.1 acetyl-CoA acetyltransferase [Anaeromyxobacter dehalogenans 2CP-1]
MGMNGSPPPGRRAAVVAGLRTPFVKAGTDFKDLSATDLGALVVNELVVRSGLPPEAFDSVIFGQVIPSPTVTLIGREMVLRTQLPRSVQAHTVARACATSIQAATDAADQIRLGHSDCAIAGGAESVSDAPIFASRPLAQALVELSRARTLAERARILAGLRPKDFTPTPPALKEPTTGLTMGESAERMAQVNGISRAAQDRLAYESHRRAAEAWDAGRFDEEVMHVPVPPRYDHVAARDNIVRKDTTVEALAKLRPVFDRKYGTITAGNASPLTDGAAALVIMSEERAKALGMKPLGFLKAYAYAALDPRDQLLQGPAYAAPVALERAGLRLADMDLVDMHEAFAAQVLSNLQAFASKDFAERELGRSEPLGEVDPAKLNVNGGSIALGHPFAATGARMILQTLRELGRRGGQHALITVCAAGGLGAAVVLERE